MQITDPVPTHRLDPNGPCRPLPEDSPHGTTIPRHIAAVGDYILAMLFAVVTAKQIPDSLVVVQLTAAILSYLAYYFVSEWAFGATPAKYVNGLTVRDFDGGRCSLRQTAIRTLFRVLEVNPFLLGGIPAAASILYSRDKQRFGDKVAGTVVVRR